MLLAIVALEVPLGLSLSDRVDAEARLQASEQAAVAAATAADLLRARDRAELQRLVERTAAKSRGRVVVVDDAGRLIADSAGPSRSGEDFTGRPEIAAALGGEQIQETRHSKTLNADILATAIPILRRGAPAGAVRITQSVSAVTSAVRRAIVGLAAIGAVVLALGIGAGYLIALQVAGPIQRLEAAARRVAGGDLGARAVVEGSSEQRSLARSFNDMTGRLERALRSQRDFVADASHQLRTPLTGMRLRVEEAQSAPTLEAAGHELEHATREIDRLAELVDELLILSRAGEVDGPGEIVDLGEAARDTMLRWRATAKTRGLELHYRQDTDAGAVFCARADLDRALDALVENALQYGTRGTAVTIVAGYGSLEVLDEGPGLAPGEEERVFERFHRGRRGHRGPPGTGLGLPIARELAERWGGETTITNREGRGARASLRLPPHPSH